MKKISFLSACMLFISSLQASSDITFSTGFIIINKARVQSIQVDIPNSSNFQDAFLAWMNEEYDYGLDGGKITQVQQNLYSAIGAQFPEISDKKLDLYVQQSNTMDGVRLSFYVSFEFDTWMNWEQHTLEFTKFVGVIKRFVHNYAMPKPELVESNSYY